VKIIIASDHAGYELKESIIHNFRSKFTIEDLGTFSSESVDYPDFAHKLAKKIENDEAQWGILLCGSGNGVAMTANKHNNVRAALSWNVEIARLARSHNNANVLVLPARFISSDLAFEIINCFFSTPFEGGRHALRVTKINYNH